MVFRSVLTIAGGAALWGLFVLSTHLFWPPPTRELLTIPPQEMPGNDPFHDSADRNLRKVVHSDVWLTAEGLDRPSAKYVACKDLLQSTDQTSHCDLEQSYPAGVS